MTSTGSSTMLPSRRSVLPMACARSALIEARDLVHRLFCDAANGAIDSNLASDVNAVLADAVVSLTTSTDVRRIRVTSHAPARSVAVQAIINAVELVHEHPDRIRSCDDEHCVLWFVDTSKSGQRRWCTMERCGNRAKARRHYTRARDRLPTDER
jgi:predicted RNA-binding Zn ribbon-like protein